MRIDVLRVIFEKIGIAYDTDADVLARAAKQMDGYTATDMQNVVEKAAHLAISESGTSILQLKKSAAFYLNVYIFTLQAEQRMFM